MPNDLGHGPLWKRHSYEMKRERENWNAQSSVTHAKGARKNRTKNKKPIPLETLRTNIQYAWLQFLCLVCGKLRCTHYDLAKKNVFLFAVSVRMVKVNFNFNFSSFVFPLRSFLSIYWSIIADCGRCLWMVFLIEFHVAFDCVISLNSKDVSLLHVEKRLVHKHSSKTFFAFVLFNDQRH